MRYGTARNADRRGGHDPGRRRGRGRLGRHYVGTASISGGGLGSGRRSQARVGNVSCGQTLTESTVVENRAGGGLVRDLRISGDGIGNVIEAQALRVAVAGNTVFGRAIGILVGGTTRASTPRARAARAWTATARPSAPGSARLQGRAPGTSRYRAGLLFKPARRGAPSAGVDSGGMRLIGRSDGLTTLASRRRWHASHRMRLRAHGQIDYDHLGHGAEGSELTARARRAW
jgi:hypothetical protein